MTDGVALYLHANQTNSIACSDTDIPSSSECTNKILHHKTQVRERKTNQDTTATVITVIIHVMRGKNYVKNDHLRADANKVENQARFNWQSCHVG